MEQKIKNLQGQFRYLIPVKEHLAKSSTEEATLIFIEEIYSFEHKASVFLKYRQIAGPDLNHSLSDIIHTSEFDFGTMSYVSITQLANRKLCLQETWLNEKIKVYNTISSPYISYPPIWGGGAMGGTVTLCDSSTTHTSGTIG